MAQELLMNCTPQETRVAVVENGVLQEVAIERDGHRGIVGNIYKGRVQRVLPGMQAAFVDIGLARTAFLHASDVAVAPDTETGETRLRRPVPDVRELLHDGQEVVVQVLKDPMGSKGARLTTHLTVPSRYLVLMPRTRNLGVSGRIEDAGERERLRLIGQRFLDEGDSGGYIIRTAAEGASEAALEADRRFLCKLW
ncbi:MAG: ribonuclease E/G, partial [Ectothiorhodospiraceae bacterium]